MLKQRILLLSLALLTVAVAATTVLSPGVAVVWLGLAMLPALGYPAGRALLFIVGALTVLATAGGLTPVKLAYLSVLLICGLVAMVRAVRLLRTPWGSRFKFPLGGSLVLIVLVFIWAGGGLAAGRGMSDVARDSFTYFIIALAVPIALDAASTVTNRTAIAVTVVVATVTGLSFAVQLLAVRGVSALGLEGIALASFMTTAVGLSLSIVLALRDRRIRWRWLFYASGLLVAVLVTGTRSGLSILAAFPGVLGRAASGRIRLSRFLIAASVVAAATVVILPSISLVVADPLFYQTRIDSVLNIFSRGLEHDLSGAMRIAKTDQAIQLWQQNPAVGVGFAGVIGGVDSSGAALSFYLDTPFLYLAKFGVLGSGLLVVALAMIGYPFVSRETRELGLTAGAVGTGTFAVWLFALPFMAPTEDKGFSVAVFLIVLLLGTSLRAEMSLKTWRDHLHVDSVERSVRNVGHDQ